jgi:hypothetical protein
VVFGRGNRSHSHRRRLWNELTQSYGHLRLAVGHATDGVADRVAPSYERARAAAGRGLSTTRSAISPLYEQRWRQDDRFTNARREHRMGNRKKRWPALVGILAAGAAVGAAGAMFARRRRAAAQWTEYGPGIDDIDNLPNAHGTGHAALTKVTAGAAAVAESVSAQAGKIADTLHEKADSLQASGSSGPADSAGSSGITGPSSTTSAATSAKTPATTGSSSGSSTGSRASTGTAGSARTDSASRTDSGARTDSASRTDSGSTSARPLAGTTSSARSFPGFGEKDDTGNTSRG